LTADDERGEEEAQKQQKELGAKFARQFDAVDAHLGRRRRRLVGSVSSASASSSKQNKKTQKTARNSLLIL
jgi:hypothetical protein